MKISKWLMILIGISILGTVIIYPNLPQQVPTHWNFKGEIDGYQSKPWVFFMAILPMLLYLLMIFIPRIDPKKASYTKHKNAYQIVQSLVVLLLIGLHWIANFAALDYDINVGFVVRIMIGIVFIVIGNYSAQIRQNYFFGIRTPWALANEQVWKKTQRAGGYAFIAMGIIMMLSTLLPSRLSGIVLMANIFIGIGFVYLYSYLVYKKISK